MNPKVIKKKILYISHEMAPYTDDTPLGIASHSLPQYMQDNAYEVRVFMPKFGTIKDRKHRLHEVIRLSGINIPIGEDDNPLLIKVASLPSAKMQVYFLDNEDFFKNRNVFYGDENDFYSDNADRVVFFNKGIMEIIHKLGWIPDIIHCQGWMSGLVFPYARTISRNKPVFRNTRFIYSVYEPEKNESLGAHFVDRAFIAGQDKNYFENLQNPTCYDLCVAGATFADAITLSEKVDETLASQIRQLDKPLLDDSFYDGDDFAQVHEEFYNLLFAEPVA